MMLCLICKERKAVVRLTQIEGEKMQVIDLCLGCAREKGVNDPAGFSLADLLCTLAAGKKGNEGTPSHHSAAIDSILTEARYEKD